MKVYFISGLGADSRIFHYISLPEGFDPVFLEWIKPKSNESLQHYALRMADSVSTTEPFALVGLSMGGMIAVEMAKRFPPQKLILLSSVPTRKELPGYFNYFQKLRLHRVVPPGVFKSASILKRIFTTERAEDKTLLSQIIRDTDPDFVKWAMEAILNWDNDETPSPCWHIHGDKDEILPLRYTTATHVLQGGTHMMVLNQYEQINEILAEILLEGGG